VLISVVTVCFNAAATIPHTIASFLGQTERRAELIVVDGASPDGTAGIARSFGDPRIRVVSEPDGGVYEAMNKGLALYRGDAVGFLNADDRFHDAHALAAIAEGLEEADVVFGDLDFVRDHETSRVVRRWRASPWRPGAFRRGWMPPHPTFYVRRAVAERVGGFDTALRIAADYDFMLRALEHGEVRAARIGRTLVDMAIGGQSTAGARSYLQGNLEALASRRRWLGAGPLDYALLAKPLAKLGQFAPRTPDGRR
jgi:glycosyltransferase involved in cell wall biosynthesis